MPRTYEEIDEAVNDIRYWVADYADQVSLDHLDTLAAQAKRVPNLEIALMQLTNDNLQYVARVVEVQARATEVQAERELALARVTELEAEVARLTAELDARNKAS